ncbi:hypothetical protein PG993_010899 [Apiospora rasikravindrae]|uniref:ATPase AAA-type core domain-containing protein n=1 Tax=Apiospora rasikravindrae TaxID=990691 RepID=A0ABR1SE80_9PEZI
MKVRCAFIDFNGKGFGPVSITFSIPPFGGLKDMDSLPIYPLRLSKAVGLRDSLIARGKMLLNIITLKPMYYTGDALHTGEEIDSQVIVDFSEALADEQRKQWTPRIASVYTSSDVPEDDCQYLCCAYTNVASGSQIDVYLADRSLDELVPSTPFRPPSLIPSPRSLDEIIPGTEDEPSDDEFLLMTYRAFAFVLRTRKWAQIDLTYLRYENKDVRDSTLSAFDRLELPEGHREMVRSLVTEHFRDRRAAEAKDDRTDLARGSLCFSMALLELGKPPLPVNNFRSNPNLRLVADCSIEGVAELLKKPLFYITCGEEEINAGNLGIIARDVEQGLEKNFALASRWGCILLLDEADVFLSARERKDFERNGSVAVFLRVLEYYTGILFLTTNRIGDFDEAFASRIHISLFYPELDELKTKKVFKLNLDLIQERFDRQNCKITFDASSIEDFAEHHYREHKTSRWNGRQIRNACQTALALAEYDAHGGRVAQDDDDANDSSIVVSLQLRHFRLVQTAYQDFGRYLGDIRGTQGDRRAIDYGLRAKTHTPYQTNDHSYPSGTGNPAGLNVNRYRPNPLSSGQSSMYDYPSQGSQVVDPPYRPVSQGELGGGGGTYTVNAPPDIGHSMYGQHGHSQGQLQGPGGMYNMQANPQSQGYSYSGNQPGQMEPRQYQPPNQQVLGRSWGNPGPVSNQGYPPTSEPQQGQAQASSSQWQTTQAQQQQVPPLYRYSNVQHGGGSQIPTSGADFALQSQASFGRQGGAPGAAGTSQGA